MKTQRTNTLPMKTSGIEHLVNRTYREGGDFQWVREVQVNAIEAGAKHIEFGIEWQAVKTKHVYRRTIADDGNGMTAQQLRDFFNTFGGGGKAIGGVHENFGVGAKTSLLPWNAYGVVVVSWVRDEGNPQGKAAMIWLRRDPATGEYGLKLFDAADDGGTSRESVVEPFDDPTSGVDWRAVKPDWIKDHGTVIVLLGPTGKEDTVLGDPDRAEADLKGLASYLNRRFWALPEGVTVTVDELRTTERKDWPRGEDEGHATSSGAERRTNMRVVQGARHFVEYSNVRFHGGKIESKGHLDLRDGTRVDWYLWDEKERPNIHSYAAMYGYVAALYHGELYDVAAHHAIYRNFGVTDATVRQRLWIILTPQPYDAKTHKGVYPRTDRNALLLQSGPEAGTPLPIHRWAAEFSENMPDAIHEALRRARGTESASVEDMRKALGRLIERFGARFRIDRLRVQRGGPEEVEPYQAGGSIAQDVHDKASPEARGEPAEEPAVTGIHGQPILGDRQGPKKAVRSQVGGGVPIYRPVHSEEVEPGMLAAWQPHDPDHPEGVVLLNGDHPILTELVQYWQDRYPDHLSDAIRADVIDVYGTVAVAKIAHSERLKGLLPADVVETELRSDAALTMSLLGLMAEDHMIAARLGAKYGKKRVIEIEGNILRPVA